MTSYGMSPYRRLKAGLTKYGDKYHLFHGQHEGESINDEKKRLTNEDKEQIKKDLALAENKIKEFNFNKI